MQELVDVHIFADAHAILEGLAQRDCSAALAWCAQHHTRLRKLRSKLEFMLHTQVCLRELPPALSLHSQPCCVPVSLLLILLLWGAQAIPCPVYCP